MDSLSAPSVFFINRYSSKSTCNTAQVNHCEAKKYMKEENGPVFDGRFWV